MVTHQFEPFEALLTRIRGTRVRRWEEIEDEFLRVVGLFDANYTAGKEKSGWYQSKARYFNDIIVDLLKNVSGKDIHLRCKRDSQIFDLIDIDICYPAKGSPIVAGEVKALGTPPHKGNKNKGRAGSQDLHKRVREVAFTSMDLKAAYAPPQPIGSFQRWIDTTTPGYFSFWAVRADNSKDLERVRNTLTNLRAYCNGVGAVIYTPNDGTTSYSVERLSVLSIDRAIKEMAQRIA